MPVPKVVCEIFPVTLREGRVLLLQPEGCGSHTAWRVSCDATLQPSLVVSREVAARFCPAPDCRPSVLHSTSWRYERGPDDEGTIVLTYLVVLPTACWTDRPSGDGSIAQITATCARGISQCVGDRLGGRARSRS